jgi:predicted CoA-binding protein
VDPKEIMRGAHTILVIDWPSKDVPESLAGAGFEVIVRGGPGPTDYSVYERNGAEIAVRPLGRAPERADLVYCYRPLAELPAIIEMARQLGAKAIWPEFAQTGGGEMESARRAVESAGLQFAGGSYIGEVAREIGR